MKKIITTLYLVLAASKIYAQEFSIYGDPNCLQNKTEIINCEADGKYQYSQQKIQIEIQHKKACHYYRYAEHGFWSIKVYTNNQQISELTSSFGELPVILKDYPWNFELSELFDMSPFQIKLDSNSVQIKKFEVIRTPISNKFPCKPGSALSDDYCNPKQELTSYHIDTEEILFENLKCQKSVQ